MRIGLVLAAGVLASGSLAFGSPALAQGLMSGTGMQPSQMLATPPGTPAIDRPGAARASEAAASRRDETERPMAARRPAASPKPRQAAPERPPGFR